jgi:hypothetical protein
MTGYTYTHAYILGYEFSRAVEAGEATFQSFIHFLGIIDTLINVNNMLDDRAFHVMPTIFDFHRNSKIIQEF